MSELRIPVFATYSSLEDSMIELYRKEKKEIRRVYEGQDFLDLTLQKLTGMHN